MKLRSPSASRADCTLNRLSFRQNIARLYEGLNMIQTRLCFVMPSAAPMPLSSFRVGV